MAGAGGRGGGGRTGGLQIPAYLSRANGQGALDAHAAVEKWRTIEHAITQIYKQNASSLSFQALYTAGYHIILHKHGEILYTGVEHALNKHVCDHRALVLEAGDANFLESLLEQWDRHRTSVQMVRDILMYMDKNYVPSTKRLSVYDLGVKAFGDFMLKSKHVADRVHRLTMGIIVQERSGERPLGPFLLKGVTKMMCEVGRKEVYEPCLEQHFLQASAEYYTQEASDFFNKSTTPEYIQRVFRRLDEERDRVERCLTEQTRDKIETVIKDCMLRGYADGMLEKEGSGCMSMLDDWRVADLRLLYEAFRIIGNTQPLIDRVQGFLRERGMKFVQDPEQNDNPCSLIDGMVAMREKYDELLDGACYLEARGARTRDKVFEKAVKDAFVDIVNKNTRFAEFLSIFVDSKLRKKGCGSDDYDACFDKVLVLFRYLRDKDMFEKYYKTHLAKRLLFGKSGGEEGERAFIAKLKQENGHQFTTKIEGMFKDMDICQGNMERFRAKLQERVAREQPVPNVDISVQVLTTGFWPLSKSSADAAVLTPDVEHARQLFQQFYLSSHNGRRLTWQLNMGSADMRFTTPSRKYEINVHTLQMVVLLRFNDRPEWTLAELAEETKIPLSELRKQVMSLTLQTKLHTRVLARSCAQSKDIEGTTKLSINPDFKSKHVKIKISPVVVKETEDEARETRSRVDDDRKWQVDAVIVRIMKSRKTMEHRNLIADCIAHLKDRFAPTPDDIKRRVESLIEREYLERSKESRSIYVYLA